MQGKQGIPWMQWIDISLIMRELKMLMQKGVSVKEISQLVGRGLHTVKEYWQIAHIYHPELSYEKELRSK